MFNHQIDQEVRGEMTKKTIDQGVRGEMPKKTKNKTIASLDGLQEKNNIIRRPLSVPRQRSYST